MLTSAPVKFKHRVLIVNQRTGAERFIDVETESISFCDVQRESAKVRKGLGLHGYTIGESGELLTEAF